VDPRQGREAGKFDLHKLGQVTSNLAVKKHGRAAGHQLFGRDANWCMQSSPPEGVGCMTRRPLRTRWSVLGGADNAAEAHSHVEGFRQPARGPHAGKGL